MRAREFLKLIFEAAAAPTAVPGDPNLDPLYNLKLLIANKIKVLTPDPATEKALHEIEDLLASVGAGTKTQVVGRELEKIKDVDVNAAQRLLAKYIYSLDASPADKKSMLEQWATDDGLIDLAILLSPGKNTVKTVVKGYATNPAIEELTNDLAQVAALGQGKGEFLLSVFSKRITKAKKGDLDITNFGQVEVKTTDGGAGRFHDQQVRPSPSYQQAVNDFLTTFNETLTSAKLKTSTGVNIDQLVALKNALPVEQRDLFKEKLTTAITNVFVATPDAAGPIVDAIMVGNSGAAKQRYAVAALNNYMAAKTEDKGILVINLRKDPYTFVFFNDNQSLNEGGMRLHAGTIYPITNDVRYAYPQTDIVETSQTQQDAGSAVAAPVAKIPTPKVVNPKVAAAPAIAPAASKLAKPPASVRNQQATMATTKVPMGQPPESDL
jgi:hypothetical protein